MSDLEMQEESRGGGCMKPLLIGCGVLFVLFVVGVIGVGVLIQRGTIAFQDPTPIRGEELSEDLLADLRDVGIGEDETVLWYSGVKFWIFNAYGHVLTDRRVVYYELSDEQKNQAEYEVSEVALEDVRGVDAEFGAPASNETVVTVYSEGQDGQLQADVALLLPAIDDLDHSFVADIVAAARGAGAEVATIRFSGVVSEAELGAVEGAVRIDDE